MLVDTLLRIQLNCHVVTQWLCAAVQATDLEVNMNAVERMVEYTSQPTEGSGQTLTQSPPHSWPHAGAITIDNLQVQLTSILVKEVVHLFPHGWHACRHQASQKGFMCIS